jgi:hypothetical protein
MAEKRAKKAAEEAKEAQANEQIRRKSGKVLVENVFVVEGADSRPLGHWEIARRTEGEGKSEGYGKEEAR